MYYSESVMSFFTPFEMMEWEIAEEFAIYDEILDGMEEPSILDELEQFADQHNTDKMAHKTQLLNVLVELRYTVRLMRNTRIYEWAHEAFMPHAGSEMSPKKAAQDKYLRKKKDSGRFNKKEEKNRKMKERKKLLEKFGKTMENRPHGFSESTAAQFVGDLSKYLGSFEGQEADDIIRHAENVCVLAYGLVRSRSISDVVISLVSYMKFYMKSSFTVIVSNIISVFAQKPVHDVTSQEVSDFLDETEAFDMDVPHALSGRDILDSWELLKTNAIFKKISFLITAAMSSSICRIKEVKFDIAGIPLIAFEAMKTQLKASDLIDALIQTFVWVSETGWACLKEKSLAPILYQDQRIKEYTEKCNIVVAYASTAMAGNLDNQCPTPDLASYERLLDQCLKMTGDIQRVTSSPGVREVLQHKYAALVQIKADVVNKRRNTAFRFAPIGFSIYGESSIGKSDISLLTMKTSLSAMDFSDAQEGLVTLNESDKFDSTYTSDVVGVFIDDANNASSKFVEKSPTQKYIQFFNNVAAQAVKAELNEKGCVFIDFKCGVLTTNTKTLGAQYYSNYPVAVLRRFFHVTAIVNPTYRVPNGTSLNVNHPAILNAPPGTFVDVWLFDIEEVVPNGTAMGQFQPVVLDFNDGNGSVPCSQLNLAKYLAAITMLSAEHKTRQTRQVTRASQLESMRCCQGCNMIQQFCQCPQFTPRPQAFVESCATYVVRTFFNEVFKRVFTFCSPFLSGMIYSQARHFLPIKEVQDLFDTSVRRTVPLLATYAPEIVFHNTYFQRLLGMFEQRYHYFNVQRVQQLVNNFLPLFSFFCFFRFGISGGCCAFACGWFLIIVCESMIVKEREHLREILVQRRDEALTDYGKRIRDRWAVTGVLATVSMIGIVVALKAWNASRRKPHSIHNPEDLDKSGSWFGFLLGKTHKKIDCIQSGATTDQLCGIMEKNLCWGSFKLENGNRNKCGVFFPRKSVMLFPRHIFYPKSDMTGMPSNTLECDVVRHDSVGGKFSVKIRHEYCYHFPTLDLVAAFVPNSPDFASRHKWLPLSPPNGESLAVILSPMQDGTKRRGAISAKFQRVSHCYMEMQGMSYTSHLSQNGACMSPVISEGKNPCVLGFHIGGNNITQRGIAQTLMQNDLQKAYDWLDGINSLSAETSDIPKQQMGIDILTSTDVHSKAKYIQSLDSDNFVEVVGSTRVRAEQKSRVVPSILSDAVTDICGIPNTWGPPKLKPNWDAYNKNIALISNPGDMFDPKLLRRARDDWYKPVKIAIQKYVWSGKEDFRPLTQKEAIMGIDGKKFIDALPMNTGVGFPLFGKKNKADATGEMVHFDEIRDNGLLVERIPRRHIQEEIERLLSCYKKGLRAYPVTSATLKDEPTDVNSEKVRVFQAAPIALSILIRKYFLPIARFLHLHALIVESAVGLNAFARDWQELMDYTEKFGDDGKLLGWDYSKYDTRMNSQMTRAAWDILISLAHDGGYDGESITIMKNMIVDITHPLMDVNGTMLMAYNMNTSGNNMTVDINSLAGSLYVRMAFFTCYPEKTDFRESVALITYGDDAKGSNAKDTRDFNFLFYKKFLADHGMKLTLPSKSDEEVAFLTREESDFLKRKSSYIPEIGTSIGRLDESSIFKSLHANLKSATATPREVAASVIETALHEWFAYGRTHYEKRRLEMTKVCEQVDLPVSALNYTFDERVAFWKEKYPEG